MSWENYTCNFTICSVHSRDAHSSTYVFMSLVGLCKYSNSRIARSAWLMVQVSILGNGKTIFFFTASTLALVSTQSLIQLVPGALSPGLSSRAWTSPTTHFHFLQRTRMCSAIPPLPHTSSWRGVQLSTGTTLPPYIMRTLKKQGVRILAGFIWLRTGASDGILWTR
jgi:hypothetical protein